MAGENVGWGVSGTDQNVTDRTTTQTAQTAERNSATGAVKEIRSYGVKTEVKETAYVAAIDVPELIEGATATNEATAITTSVNAIETYNDFNKCETTKVFPGGKKKATA